jgi:hypothetical protein
LDNPWGHRPPSGLNLTLMLLAHAHAFYQDTVFPWQYTEYFPAFSFFSTAYHFDVIANLNPHLW